MINFIRKLLGLCAHKWTTVRTVDVYANDKDKLPIGHRYLQKCDHCGKLQTFKDYKS